MLGVVLEAQGFLLLRRLLCAAGSRRGCPQVLAAAAFMLPNRLWRAPQHLVQRQAARSGPLPHMLLGPQRVGQQVLTETWTLLLLLMA